MTQEDAAKKVRATIIRVLSGHRYVDDLEPGHQHDLAASNVARSLRALGPEVLLSFAGCWGSWEGAKRALSYCHGILGSMGTLTHLGSAGHGAGKALAAMKKAEADALWKEEGR